MSETIETIKPQIRFNGVQGEASIDTMGPETLSEDLNSLAHMFDPNYVNPQGIKIGGISTGNLREDFSADLPAPERYEDDPYTKVADQLKDEYEKRMAHINNVNNPHQVSAVQVSATAPLGVTGINVQAIINSLNDLLNNRYTKAQTDTKYASKIEINESTGVFTLKAPDGTILSQVDTRLEKIAINFEYDSTNQRLVITLKDGTKQYVPLSDFITEFEFVNTDDVAFTVTNHKVSATVAPKYKEDVAQYAAEAAASANNARLYSEEAKSYADEADEAKEVAESSIAISSESAAEALNYSTIAGEKATLASGYSDTAKAYKEAAAISEANASDYADAAEGYKDIAVEKSALASTSATNAGISETNASASAVTATNKALAAQSFANDSQSYAEEAEESKGIAVEKAEDASASALGAKSFEEESEAWAVGTKDGEPVASTDAQYHNNSKYWAEQAAHTVTGVSSFNGRSGFVEPMTGDYTAEMVGAASPDLVDEKIQAAIGDAINASY